MKNSIKIIAFALSGLSIVACNDTKEKDKSYDDYRAYVADHRDNSDKFHDRDWSEIEKEYVEVQRKAEADMENWNDERKAEYESMKMNWDSYRENHLAEVTRRDAIAGTKMVMKSILMEGINEDMSNVDNNNIQAVYKHLVSNVDAMKDNMTREQWDFVEILWERLDTRKNHLEDNMTAGVKVDIAKEKLAYGAIKATNRPVAKSEENQEAKDDHK